MLVYIKIANNRVEKKVDNIYTILNNLELTK